MLRDYETCGVNRSLSGHGYVQFGEQTAEAQQILAPAGTVVSEEMLVLHNQIDQELPP